MKMKTQILAASAFLTLSLVALADPIAPPSAPKFMVVILENEDFDKAIRQPFMSSMMKEGATLTQFFALGRPSQPNYIGFVAGSMLGVKTNSEVNLDESHLADLLEAKGKTWRTYAESFPGNCFLGMTKGKYARRHNPFISFKNVSSNPKRCANIQDSTRMVSDITNDTLADFSLVIPNNDSNGHDTGVAYADRWLDQTFGKLVRENRMPENLVLVLTFDEASKTNRKNQILAIFLGDRIKKGNVSKPYTLYSLLKTVQTAFKLGTLGREDEKAQPITEIWKDEARNTRFFLDAGKTSAVAH